jgi:general secretion pathway protein I
MNVPALSQRGFTLLEMLAALTVLALCCAVLLTAFGQSARSLGQVERSDRLSLAAQSFMEEISSGPLAPGHSAGQWDEGMRWELDIRQQASSVPQVVLYRLDLSLAGEGQRMHFSTLQVRTASTGAVQGANP